MARATRTVQRLHLRAGSESAVRHALPSLEDAFRTATLPDLGARLVFVRQLNLGTLPRGASAQSLSLLLESRFSEAGLRLVHAADAPPDIHDAVWFRDSLQAHELAALHVAAGRSVAAWFWPLAVPALAGATTPGDRLRAIAFSLAIQDEAPAALPAWTESLVRAGHGDRLVHALRPGDGTALLRAAGVTHPAESQRIDSASVARDPDSGTSGSNAPLAQSARGARAASRLPADDDRVAFVEQMLRRTNARPFPARAVSTPGWLVDRTRPQRTPIADRPAQAGDVTVPPREAHAATGTDAASQIARDANPFGPQLRAGGSATLAKQPNGTAPAENATAGQVDRSCGPRPDVSQIDGRAARDGRPDASPVTHRSPWATAGAVPTAAGGLLFLVPALERLGFGEWWARSVADHHSPPGVVAGPIFHLLLSRLRIPEDDPAWQLASADDAGGSPEDGGSPALWLSACRRLLRRHARIGLASLVLRPARLAITRTHADVFFGLTAADLRIRRAGLDIDPGWVPWFARVVAFHYEERPWN